MSNNCLKKRKENAEIFEAAWTNSKFQNGINVVIRKREISKD
ncbi:hypothetical protein NC652_026446 [Populus alba x Populus x berolinensis]|uniref:Uncharacterized protein n=1 Tax=Populus alba x Populus x berolinensis TaxID=444605 RepID=A0AAD6QAN3_9ROSI|nr:hypothetical protein NC652_026446 [Populus alba x Populus x berolinensis]KAJ6983093.1 hypothetical protein NC653_026034 [Populus alba x Populus x berolinensis]